MTTLKLTADKPTLLERVISLRMYLNGSCDRHLCFEHMIELRKDLQYKLDNWYSKKEDEIDIAIKTIFIVMLKTMVAYINEQIAKGNHDDNPYLSYYRPWWCPDCEDLEPNICNGQYKTKALEEMIEQWGKM